jgi:dihydroorotase
MSLKGAEFYGLLQNQGSITLERKEWTIPDSLPYPGSSLIPFKAGQVLQWKIIDND